MIRRPPRSTRTDTLFPYTTLFRSVALQHVVSLRETTETRDLVAMADCEVQHVLHAQRAVKLHRKLLTGQILAVHQRHVKEPFFLHAQQPVPTLVERFAHPRPRRTVQLGRASCRERVGHTVYVPGVAVSLKK